ncbi:accessory factor associated with RNA polymerase II [Rhizina undulata]
MSDPSLSDPLSLLRISIQHDTPPTLTVTSGAPSSPSTTPISLSDATYLHFFPCGPTTEVASLPLSAPTRFIKSDKTPVDLRSIYFAWQHREDTIPDYISKAQSLGDEVVTNLAFLERLELVTWLEGGQEESEFIGPLQAAGAATAAGAAAGAGDELGGSVSQGKASQSSQALAGKVRVTDPRLLEIYSYERVVSNRNLHLRGIKPTDFSHVRKQAEDFITRLRAQKDTMTPQPSSGSKHALPLRPGSTHPGKPAASKSRNKDPIILLSPSASSLLNMSNVKPFLESGVFSPPTPHSSSSPQLQHVSRLLPTLHPTQPIRFIIVDTPEKFKPDYWERVVAVFTTGQLWQFKNYRWSNPVDLFREVRGFYVGWDGERVPDTVKGWGGGVVNLSLDRGRRFRDREVCEVVWEGIERFMRGKGWDGSR